MTKTMNVSKYDQILQKPVYKVLRIMLKLLNMTENQTVRGNEL